MYSKIHAYLHVLAERSVYMLHRVLELQQLLNLNLLRYVKLSQLQQNTVNLDHTCSFYRNNHLVQI